MSDRLNRRNYRPLHVITQLNCVESNQIDSTSIWFSFKVFSIIFFSLYFMSLINRIFESHQSGQRSTFGSSRPPTRIIHVLGFEASRLWWGFPLVGSIHWLDEQNMGFLPTTRATTHLPATFQIPIFSPDVLN